MRAGVMGRLVQEGPQGASEVPEGHPSPSLDAWELPVWKPLRDASSQGLGTGKGRTLELHLGTSPTDVLVSVNSTDMAGWFYSWLKFKTNTGICACQRVNDPHK